MKNYLKLGLYLLFSVLIAANIFIFVSGMKLSQGINKFETETKRLKQENMELENKFYRTNSLEFASIFAKELDLTQKAEPYYLENLGFAKKE